jgi:DNA-binding transcriptional ArsR family regulator
VEHRGWPDRLVIALEQSLFHGTDRATYAAEAEVSAPTATNDLRRLMDAGLIRQQGRGPSTRYVASERLVDDLRRRLSDANENQHGGRASEGTEPVGNNRARA